MLRIVRVNAQQFADMMHKIAPENRWMMDKFPATNFYLSGERVLIVLADEVTVKDFPQEDFLSLSAAIQCALS